MAESRSTGCMHHVPCIRPPAGGHRGRRGRCCEVAPETHTQRLRVAPMLAPHSASPPGFLPMEEERLPRRWACGAAAASWGWGGNANEMWPHEEGYPGKHRHAGSAPTRKAGGCAARRGRVPGKVKNGTHQPPRQISEGVPVKQALGGGGSGGDAMPDS